MGLEQDISDLFSSIKQLFHSDTARQTPSSKGNVFQAPIKGSWKSSGGFSTQPTDARHPKGHAGVDLRAPGGTSVYPLSNGTVTNVGTDPAGGNVVNVQHADGIRTYYAHLGTIAVHKGDQVTKDSVLGTVGESGNAKGTVPHCHFQVWKDGQIQNPAEFFSVPPYEPMGKDEKRWLDGAEQVASNWSIRDHLAQRPATAVASNSKIDLLVRACATYDELASKL